MNSTSTDVEGHSLLLLDSFCIVRIGQSLTSPRDLASLQVTCRSLRDLLQPSDIWADILSLNYGGLRLQRICAQAVADKSSESLPTKELCRMLKLSAQNLHPVRFVALYTDGGVDTGAHHYWADHAFIPNSWAPFCAKYMENVNLLAVLKTGPDATSELSHRQMMISCLKWLFTLCQLNVTPVAFMEDQFLVDPAALEKEAASLSTWKTQRLELIFCQMEARAAVRDPMGLVMLRGIPATMETRNAAREQRPVDPVKVLEERREVARVMSQEIQKRSWYDRAYSLKFVQDPLTLQQRSQQQRLQIATEFQGGGALPPQLGAIERLGGRRGAQLRDSSQVVDDMALSSELMSQQATSSVALLHGLAVSRAGRLSCPIQSGALAAGVLPPDWPQGAMAAMGPPIGAVAGAPSSSVPLQSHAALMRAIVEQPSVRTLNDKQDAESVFAACASGQLPPWVRHVVLNHAEYIEFLPPHLAVAAGAWSAAGGKGQRAVGEGTDVRAATADSACGSSEHPWEGVPTLHPVIWFRFSDHAEYSRRRLSIRTRNLLFQVAELFSDAAVMLVEEVDQRLEDLRSEVMGWLGPRPGPASRPRAPTQLEAAAASTSVGTAATAASGAGSYSCTGAPHLAASTAPAAGVSSSSLPRILDRPNCLSQAQHRFGRLLDRLMSLGTAAAVLTPQLRDVAGFSLPDGDVHSMLERAMAMKQTLHDVGKKLRIIKQVGRGDLENVRADVEVARDSAGAADEWSTRDGANEGEDDEREDKDNDDMQAKDVDADAAPQHLKGAHNGGCISGPGRQGEEQRTLKAHAVQVHGFSTVERAEPERLLETTWRTEMQRLWDMLEGEALGEDGRQARLSLAATLRTRALAAEAVQAGSPNVVEHYNEALLRRLNVHMPHLSANMSTDAVASAAATHFPADVAIGHGTDSTATAAAVAGGSGGCGSIPVPQATAGAISAPVLEPPPPEGWAEERLFDPQLQLDVDSGVVVLPDADADGHRVHHLAAQLLFPVAANTVVFKAIRPENLMSMVGWDHNEEPNVDVQYVALQGRVVRLPLGVQAVPYS